MRKNPHNEYTIRRATVEDTESILSLIKALATYEKLSHEVIATRKDLETFGFTDPAVFHTFIAETPSAAVGLALYFFTFSTFVGRPTLYLEDLFVLPEYRGKGIGKALLQTLAREALAKHCRRMEWSVLDWNQPAIDFYQQLGAQPMDDWTVFRLQEASMHALVADLQE